VTTKRGGKRQRGKDVRKKGHELGGATEPFAPGAPGMRIEPFAEAQGENSRLMIPFNI
jgi:hypothetical protein